MTAHAPHNLGAPISSFVGRAEELAEVRTLVDQHRLITLTGVGGCGKSRLADALCRRLLTDRSLPRDGVRWVDLGSLSDPEEVAEACLTALRLRREPEGDPVDTLCQALVDRQLLLCLDTCEHLLDAVADLADRVLRAAPGVTLLTTSREPLGIAGEAVCRVPSLNPRDAVDLFVARARLAGADLEGAPDVAAICRRVDHLPLAIELAAGWTHVLGPRQLLDGLDDRFRLLTGGARRAIPRHQTLLASIDWSHDLLAEPEQVVLRRLGVFAGHVDLDGVLQVCGDPDTPSDEVIALVGRLVDKSLVVCDQTHEPVRYRLLDTVRHYAEERLVAADEVAAVRDRHLEWCTARAEAAAARSTDDWLAEVRALGDNVRAALDWGLEGHATRVTRGRRLLAAMVMPWLLTGRTHEALGMLARVDEQGRPDAVGERLETGAALVRMVSGPRGRPGPLRRRARTPTAWPGHARSSWGPSPASSSTTRPASGRLSSRRPSPSSPATASAATSVGSWRPSASPPGSATRRRSTSSVPP